MNALDRKLDVTFFDGYGAQNATRDVLSLRDLLPRLETTTAARKEDLPWIKLASFGNKRTDKGSLRNNGNVLSISGVEGDYDAEVISLDDAAAMLALCGLAAVVYTSRSHAPAKPRWRVLCPCSHALPPGERAALIARLNGAFDGQLSGESHTLSQSYYLGSVNSNPSHRVWALEGRFLDEATELPEVAKRGKPAPASDPDTIAPMPDEGPSDAALIAELVTGASYHETLRGLAARYAGRGMRDIAGTIRGFMEVVPVADRDARWCERVAEIPALVSSAVAKYAPGPSSDGTGPLVLNRAAPLRAAKELLRRRFTSGGSRTVHHQGHMFYRWDRTHYVEAAREEVSAVVYAFLDGASHRGKDGVERFNPTRARVGDVMDALAAEAQLPRTVHAPAWLGDDTGRPAASEVLACANGLLHLPTRCLLPHTPQFFSVNAIPYAFETEAPPAGEWLRFLRTIWPSDQQSIDTLQELFGLLLTAETRHQKIFLIVGPKRSGKGTIARVLTALLGRANVCNPTLAGIGQNFGLAPLIGKPLALIADARLGGRTDPHVIAERLLSISGEDGQTIDRKLLESWTGTLPTRFAVLTNELPRLSDASGALAGRFIILQMTRSFYGQEDLGLTSRLLPELPGILNWAIAGLDRLNARGHFVQPASAHEAIEELADLASPIGAFVKTACVVGAGHSVGCDSMYASWQQWCHEQHIERIGTKSTFSRDLRAAVPALETRQVRTPDAERVREYRGIGLVPRPD